MDIGRGSGVGVVIYDTSWKKRNPLSKRNKAEIINCTRTESTIMRSRIKKKKKKK